MDTISCELCGTESAYNFHHFIPKTLHSNKWFKKRYTREQMSEGIDVCKSCHKAIHEPNEKKLGRQYNTKKKLLSHPQILTYIKWKKGK